MALMGLRVWTSVLTIRCQFIQTRAGQTGLLIRTLKTAERITPHQTPRDGDHAIAAGSVAGVSSRSVRCGCPPALRIGHHNRAIPAGTFTVAAGRIARAWFNWVI